MIRATGCVVLMGLLMGAGLLAAAVGCDETYGSAYYSDDCIGPDGYNWCIAGGGWDEIHSPSVEPWDFTDW